jgi:TPP-dependent trihydroxycyclohexane-1,2-dione (THcHDO) dehydratase
VKLTIVVLDNRDQLHQPAARRGVSCGLFDHVDHKRDEARVDFAGHARSWCRRRRSSIADLEQPGSRSAIREDAIVDTDPRHHQEGGAWWDVAVPKSRAGRKSAQRAAMWQPHQASSPEFHFTGSHAIGQ